MASSDYSGLTGGNSVTEVLKIANTELRELRAHYRAVTQRIRNLRIVVDALAALGFEGENQSECVLKGWSGVTSSSELTLRQSSRHEKRLNSRNYDLRRACRIALLETFEAVSGEEVYERIVRRGSFRFANSDAAVSSILEELNALTQDGELCRIVGASGILWQRTAPSDQANSALS